MKRYYKPARVWKRKATSRTTYQFNRKSYEEKRNSLLLHYFQKKGGKS